MKTKIQISKLFFLAAALLLCYQQTEAQGWAAGLRNAVLNGAVHAIKNPPRPEPRPLPTPKPVPMPVPPKPEPRIQQGNPRPSPGSLKQEYKHVELHIVKPKHQYYPSAFYKDSINYKTILMLRHEIRKKQSQGDTAALNDLLLVCEEKYIEFRDQRYLRLINYIKTYLKQDALEKEDDTE